MQVNDTVVMHYSRPCGDIPLTYLWLLLVPHCLFVNVLGDSRVRLLLVSEPCRYVELLGGNLQAGRGALAISLYTHEVIHEGLQYMGLRTRGGFGV